MRETFQPLATGFLSSWNARFSAIVARLEYQRLTKA